MIIKPMIRDNIALNSHPKGCEKNLINQIQEIADDVMIGTIPLNVLIIGGSSGYGLASRLVMAFKNKAFTYNVSYESAPQGKRTGSAGYFNNYYFAKIAQENNLSFFDLNADCFAHETKDQVIDYFKENNKKIDLVIYSVASPLRIDPDTKEKYSSVIKPINQSYSGMTIDVMKDVIKEKNLEPANDEEIAKTIKVMGGEDFLLWMKALSKADVLNNNVKAIAYTYIGSPCTYPIYKDGTIGQAKRDLEAKNHDVNKIISQLNGQSYIVSAKSVVTKASSVIPTVPLYMSALFKVMKKHHTHESIIKHIYRLYNDMIYGNNLLLDENGIIRLDSYEMDAEVQKEVTKLMNEATADNFQEILDYQEFKNGFYVINGFNLEGVDYEEDLDLSIY